MFKKEKSVLNGFYEVRERDFGVKSESRGVDRGVRMLLQPENGAGVDLRAVFSCF